MAAIEPDLSLVVENDSFLSRLGASIDLLLPPPRVCVLEITWPDGTTDREATSDHVAAQRRAIYLTKLIDPWVLAFRGDTHGLWHGSVGWRRTKLVRCLITENCIRDAAGTPILFQDRDADRILNRYWSLPA